MTSAQRRLREWPLGVVLAGVAAGLAVVLGAGEPRAGCVLAGAAVLLGAVLRAVLPARRAGMLVVRTRALDVATLAVLGCGLVGVALAVQGA